MKFSRRKLIGSIIPVGVLSLLSSKPVAAKSKIENDTSNPKNDLSYQDNHDTIISPIAFGAVRNNPDFDNTAAVLAAIKYAEKNHRALDLRGGPWRISKSLDFTLIKQVVTDWSGRLIVNPKNFETEHGYVVTIGLPGDNFRKFRALYNSIVGSFLIISENRDMPLDGVYIKGSFLALDSIRVINFNGSGICISSTWDSTITSLSAELCGNVDKYQISIESGKDTSNCLSISRIQSERAFHKCLAISCIRSVINAIHAERTQILSDNDGTNKLVSGLSYSNLIINVGNTTINQIIYDNLKGNHSSRKEISSVILNLDQSSIRDAQFVTSYVVSNFGRRSSFNNMSVLKMFTGNNLTDCSINNLNVIESFYPLSNITINGGVFNDVVINNKSKNLFFSQSKLGQLYFNKGTDNVKFNGCIISGDLDLENGISFKFNRRLDERSATPEGNMPVSFVDCIFKACVQGGENSVATFKGGVINKVNLQNRTKYIFDNVSISEFGYRGEPLFLTINCQFGKLHSWSTPKGDNYAGGSITEFSDGDRIQKYTFNIQSNTWIPH